MNRFFITKPSLSEKIDLGVRHALTAWEARGVAKEPVVYGTTLSDDPMVFIMWDYSFRKTIECKSPVWSRRRNRPVMIILLRSWAIETLERLDPWVQLFEEHRRNYPEHRIVYAANSPAEMSLLLEAGIPAVECSHNALINENVFKPPAGAKPGDQRKYEAVYNARFARYKRHHLAVGVRRITLIHYCGLSLFEPLWWAATRWQMRHAHIVNPHKWGVWPKWIGPAQVAAAYNRARVGLCLSAVEGAMLSSIQYLLCGLPVVTTPSRGGRDVFFDSDNSVTVEPTPEAVAAGVRHLIDRNIDPWAIRARAIERMTEHRSRLIAYVETFQRQHGVPDERLLSKAWMQRMEKAGKCRLE